MGDSGAEVRTGTGDPRIEEAAAILGPRARRNDSLANRCTYRVGGAADLLWPADNLADLGKLADAVAATGLPVLVVGKGSNLLVRDGGFRGIAVVLGKAFEAITQVGSDVVAGAAAFLPIVARQAVAWGLAGFEWAVGVPGSVGGAVRMNAGGHGAELADVLVSIRVLDLRTGEDEEVMATDLDLGYRTSSVRADQVVLAARVGLAPGDAVAGKALVSEIVAWRRANQPGGHNAGSVFTNPTGDSAGRLIDAAGCKGLRIGSAEVSPKHANFIQADDDGTAADVLAVMAEVVRRVEDAHGLTLHPETVIVGDDPS